MYEPFDAAEDLQDELKEDDDERVIADMSGLAPKRPILFPVFDAGKQMDAQKEQFRAKPQQPVDIDREGRLAALKGALGASLLSRLRHLYLRAYKAVQTALSGNQTKKDPP